jgi:hypothetical protein
MQENRSGYSIIQSAINIKKWQERQPSVDEVRPATCPCCGAASCPVGGRLQIHGHGTRERQVQGPVGPNEQATSVVVIARRFRCLCCTAVMLVVPREVRARGRYSIAAIGLAFALWGLVQATTAAVRRRVSGEQQLGFNAVTGWATLRRWARAVADKRLFPSVRGPAPGATLRSVAASTAAALAALADSTTRDWPIEQRAFLGAVHAG